MNKVDKIRKINNKIVSKNKIDSFERQLINLMNGLYDMNYPMIISNNTKCLNYIDEIDENKILIINPYKVIKINNEHEIGSSFIMNIYDMLSTSLFAMDSITQPTSKVIVLDELDERDGSPIIAICRYDAKRDGKGLDAEVIAKFYNPYGHGTWLITEGDKQEDGDYLMFGYVQLSNPHDAEFGYVTLKQLESIEIKAKLNGIPFTIGSIERDIHLPEHCNLKQAMELSDIEIPLFLIDMQEETDEVYEDEEIEI